MFVFLKDGDVAFYVPPIDICLSSILACGKRQRSRSLTASLSKPRLLGSG